MEIPQHLAELAPQSYQYSLLLLIIPNVYERTSRTTKAAAAVTEV